MLKPLLIAAALLLVSCTPDEPKVANRTPAARAAKAEAKLAIAPVPRTYIVGRNELLVLEVPVADSDHFVNIQRCFVWRDAEFKQSTLSCGQQPEIVLGSVN